MENSTTYFYQSVSGASDGKVSNEQKINIDPEANCCLTLEPANQILSDKSASETPSSQTSTSEAISISSKRFQDNEQGMDSEHAWVIDIACFFVQFFVIGNIFSFGVFLPVYIDAFNSNQANVSWIGSIGSCLNVFLGILVGGLDDRYGNEKVILVGSILIGIGFLLASFSTALWHLYLTHGLICGVGFSACFVSSTGAVGQWFKKNRGLAIGVVVSGAGLGQFAMAQVNGLLIQSVGWRSALRYLALINVLGISLCSIIIRRRLPCGHHILNLQNQREFLSNHNFSLLCWGYMLFIFGMVIPNTYLMIYAQKQVHLSFNTSVLLLSLNGITNALGRVLMGEIADLSFGRMTLMKLSSILGGIACFSWLACSSFSSLLAFSLIYGFFGGGAVSLAPSIAADILGVKKISSFMGVLYSISSIANLLSTPIAGLLSDHFESYTAAILLSGSCQMLSVLLFAYMRLNLFIEASAKKRRASRGVAMVSLMIPAAGEGGDHDQDNNTSGSSSQEMIQTKSPTVAAAAAMISRRIVNSPMDSENYERSLVLTSSEKKQREDLEEIEIEESPC